MSDDEAPAQPAVGLPTNDHSAVVTPRFRAILRTATSLTLLLLAMYAVLAVVIKHPDSQESGLIDFCSGTAAFGFGAIFGLLGGKALEL